MFSGNRTGTQRVAMAQAGLALVAGLTAGLYAGLQAGLAVLYGAGAALAVSLILVWRERQARSHPEWDQHRLLKLFIRASFERLTLLVGLLAAGLAGFKLPPLPLLLGLLLAQLGWVAAAASPKDNKNGPSARRL